jgi:hypothetical protein
MQDYMMTIKMKRRKGMPKLYEKFSFYHLPYYFIYFLIASGFHPGAFFPSGLSPDRRTQLSGDAHRGRNPGAISVICDNSPGLGNPGRSEKAEPQ